jgi:hypothetical protein
MILITKIGKISPDVKSKISYENVKNILNYSQMGNV